MSSSASSSAAPSTPSPPPPTSGKRKRGVGGGGKKKDKKDQKDKKDKKDKKRHQIRKKKQQRVSGGGEEESQDDAYRAFTSMHHSGSVTEKQQQQSPTKWIEGDQVHLRGDPLPARLWTVTHVDALDRLTVRTMDARGGLRAEDTARVVEPRDVVRPDLSMAYGPAAPDLSTSPALGGIAGVGGGGGVHFAPVINIVNDRAATTAGAAAKGGATPSGTIRRPGTAGSNEIDFGADFQVIKQ